MKNRHLITRRALIGASALGLWSARYAWAQTSIADRYPDKPIRLIPFGSAGGPIDVIARAYADKLRALWGQAIVVDAKPGASGIIAADFVAKASPDGYTILITLPLTHINVPILTPKLPYDPVRDFAPISMLAVGSPLLLARSDAPFSNLKEYVAYCKAKAGTSYGTWGIGSGAHLYGELLKRQAGIDVVHVPYKAEANNYTDLYGGQLTVTWANPGSAKAQLAAGKVKLLGVTGARRMSLFPNAPTFAEQGFSGFDVESWVGAYTTAKTPPAVVTKLTTAFQNISKQPDIKEMLQGRGFEALGSNATDFASQVKSDYPKIAELIKAAGVTAE